MPSFSWNKGIRAISHILELIYHFPTNLQLAPSHSSSTMDSPPFRPKNAIPSHLSNGPSPLSPSATETRDRKERDSLYAAIESSSGRGRQAINFDGPNGYYSPTPNMKAEHRSILKPLNGIGEEYIRDTREDAMPQTPLATSRASSPYTQHPTIDFDGLSWPSKLF